MTSRKLLLSAAIAAVLMWMPCTTAVAQTIPDQPVYLTFSGPVSVPGATLQAGKYMFKQTTSKVDRQIIQIFDDKGKSVAMVMAIGAARHDGDPVPEKPEVNFYETTPGVAQAIRMWWYPGIRTGGHEFVYPRAQAQQLAKATHNAVLTTTGQDTESGKLVRMTENGEQDLTAQAESQPAASANAAAMAPPEAAAAPATTPAPASSMAMNTATTPTPAPRRALPKTASDWPVVAATGFVALFAGLVLMSRRRLA